MTDARVLPNLLLTTDELAQVLRCSKTKAKDLLKGPSAIPSIKIGGQRRIRTSDLRDYIDSLEPSLPGDVDGGVAA